jgi:hypothetical protein
MSNDECRGEGGEGIGWEAGDMVACKQMGLALSGREGGALRNGWVTGACR